MNKTLFTNGCSWTFGGGLDQPDTRERITDLQDNIVWPAHVQRLLNFDKQVNLSAGGGSNQRILDIKPETNDCHPDELGHEQLAEYIIEAIAKKKSILRTL